MQWSEADEPSKRDMMYFFWTVEGVRREVVDYLRSQSIKVFHPSFESTDAEIEDYIKRSKLVLNISSGSPTSNNPSDFLPFVGKA